MLQKPTTISEYIATFPSEVQGKLQQLLTILRTAAPEATESLKWNQPALSYDWILFQFAAFKQHIALYPTPSVIAAFQDRLTDYETSSSTIKFPLDKPLPVEMIKKCAELRVQEAKAGVKWM